MKKLAIGIFIVLITAIVMFSMVMATTYATNTLKTDKTNTDNVQVLSKAKTVKYKITWDGNGGKIGSKKTTVTYVKKGSKINKLAATPKRSSYSFKGWFTKKSGGTKISKSTKPKKSVTFFAQWKKGSSSSGTTDKSKLIGRWMGYHPFTFNPIYYSFDSKGRFSYHTPSYNQIKIGNYKVSTGKITHKDGFYYKTQLSSGKITFTKVTYNDAQGKTLKYPDTVVEYRVVKDSEGNEVLEIPNLYYSDKNFLSYEGFFGRFTKMK